MAYQAVSRLRPLTIICWRNSPSKVKPKRIAARREVRREAAGRGEEVGPHVGAPAFVCVDELRDEVVVGPFAVVLAMMALHRTAVDCE